MNLKTSLKAKKNMLPYFKLTLLVVIALVFSITACNESEILSVDKPVTVLETSQLSTQEADFFSDEKINEFINFRNDRLDKGNDEDRTSFERSVNDTKEFIRNLNKQMEYKYIAHITQTVGYPAWSASYVADVESGGTITFVPLLQSNGENVKGLISYYRGAEEASSYSLVTRNQIAMTVEDAYDQNYNFLTQIFYKFDKELFEYKGEEYKEWANRSIWSDGGEGCYNQLLCLLGDYNGDYVCYSSCSYGCTDHIYASGIVDEEEADWLNGHCTHALYIDAFLEDNNEPDIAQTLLSAAILGQLTLSELRSLTFTLDDFLNDPDIAPYVDVMLSFVIEKNFDLESIVASEVVAELSENDLLFNNYSESDETLANQIIFDAEACYGTLTVPVFHLHYTGRVYEEYTYLTERWKVDNPGQTLGNLEKMRLFLEAKWKLLKGTTHTVLDICGLIPLMGEACDLTNGFIYLIEGDGLNATLSFGGAIPVYGWASTGARYAVLIGKNLNNGFEYALRYKRLANGTIEFRIRGNTTFRQIVGVTDVADDAHHLIPQGESAHGLVQRAANAINDHWHLHMPDNGLAVKKFNLNYPDGVHANHPNYNNQVRNKLTEIESDLKNQYNVTDIIDVPADAASAALQNFQNTLRTLIENNPTTKINDLVIP